MTSWSGHNPPHKPLLGKRAPSSQALPQSTGPDRLEQLGDQCTDRPHQQGDHQGDARSGTAKEPAEDARWQLDPQRLPRSLTLELPEPLMAQILALAEAQGRCLDEIALELLDAQMQRDRS